MHISTSAERICLQKHTNTSSEHMPTKSTLMLETNVSACKYTLVLETNISACSCTLVLETNISACRCTLVLYANRSASIIMHTVIPKTTIICLRMHTITWDEHTRCTASALLVMSAGLILWSVQTLSMLEGNYLAYCELRDILKNGRSIKQVPASSASRGCSRDGDVAVYVFDINQPNLPIPFYSVLVSISVFTALSAVFYSVNSPDNSPVLFLPYWSFQLYVSLWKSPSALV